MMTLGNFHLDMTWTEFEKKTSPLNPVYVRKVIPDIALHVLP